MHEQAPQCLPVPPPQRFRAAAATAELWQQRSGISCRYVHRRRAAACAMFQCYMMLQWGQRRNGRRGSACLRPARTRGPGRPGSSRRGSARTARTGSTQMRPRRRPAGAPASAAPQLQANMLFGDAEVTTIVGTDGKYDWWVSTGTMGYVIHGGPAAQAPQRRSQAWARFYCGYGGRRGCNSAELRCTSQLPLSCASVELRCRHSCQAPCSQASQN